MKKQIALSLALMTLLTCTACQKAPVPDVEPQTSQMRSICELAVMDCYYHNVAKFTQEDASGALWWKKDKRFWIEYSGVVKLGIDASLVTMEIKDTQVTITLPAAKVLKCDVDSSTLNEDSYIVDKDSAAIDADDEVAAFADAQRQLQENASNDHALLAQAQQRAQSLLADYVMNLGTAVGKEYTIQWVYLDADGNPLDAAESPASQDAASAPENASE